MEYVGASEAAELCGVGVSTLTRFQEAGYLTNHKDSTGELVFDRQELIKLFQIPSSKAAVASQKSQRGEKQDAYAQKSERSISESESSYTPLADKIEILREDPPSSRPVTEVKNEEEYSCGSDQIDEEVIADREDSPFIESERVPDRVESSKSHEDFNENSSESRTGDFIRLKSLVQLLERLLEQKEAELAEVKKERNWLRVRVEKQEDKADRDQMLLLTELRTVSALIESTS